MVYLSDFYNIHKGETCIILGNGPSLKHFDWGEARAREAPIFGTNRIYLSGHEPDYYVAVNDLVVQQFAEEIEKLQCHKFIPSRLKSWFDFSNNITPTITWINTEERRPIFKKCPGEMWEGFTVTYVALQIAFQMGFTEVILFGVDHYFQQQGQPNLEVMSQGEDPDHFDPNYFGKGTKWNLPDLEKSEIAYSLAKLEYERAGRSIVNASHRTRLKIFPVVNPNIVYEKKNKPVVSAIVSAYYAEKYLPRCIEDLMAQDLYKVGALEIVIASQHGSPEHMIAHEYPQGDIVHVETEDIPTIYEAWNLAIEAARGEFITNANCDDQHHPLSMALQAKILTANPGIDLVYHDQFVTWDPEMTWDKFVKKPRINVKDRLVNGRSAPGRDGVFKWGSYSRDRLITGCFVGPQPMWRRNLHQRYGMFDGSFESAGDYDYWLRIAGKDKFFYINEPIGLYLAREDGKEMQDPALSAAEALNVMIQNTCKFVAADLLVEDLVRLQVGTEYITTTPEGIQGLHQHIQNKLAQIEEERKKQ